LDQIKTFMPYSGLFARYTLDATAEGEGAGAGTTGIGEAGVMTCEAGLAAWVGTALSMDERSVAPTISEAVSDTTFRTAASEPEPRPISGAEATS
jgi:hypothetical protein